MLTWVALLLLDLAAAEPDVPTVAVTEGSDALLRCSPNPLENLNEELFDWTMGEMIDHKKDVFMYDRGSYDSHGHSRQHEQFRGRVSHFPDQLINGNASIIIRNIKIEDTGLYTCIFPYLQDQRISMRLIVDPTFRDRSGNIPGVVHKPCVSICNVSESGVQLKCEVKGVFPKPELQWLDSDGVILPAEDPEVSERGRLFDVSLQTTVNSTNTNRFRCVVKQEDFHHQIERSITVPEKLFEKPCREVDPGSCSGQMVLGIFIGALLLSGGLALLVATKCITVSLNKRRRQPPESPEDQKLNEKQNGQTPV